jgi:hypothetical protein
MKERPILFSAPMVRAILDGLKTQTRRVAKPPEKANFLPDDNWTLDMDDPGTAFNDDESGRLYIKCPYGVPGDHLYVKENSWIWCQKVIDGVTKTGRPKLRFVPCGQYVVHCADGEKPAIPVDASPTRLWRWKAARFMPRWASRITLEITDVRVQRVQEIEEDDALNEGIPDNGPGQELLPSEMFARLWDSINAERGFGWDVNPWVWALTFRRIAPV